jgi:large subunit ribosomal protein L7Ae
MSPGRAFKHVFTYWLETRGYSLYRVVMLLASQDTPPVVSRGARARCPNRRGSASPCTGGEHTMSVYVDYDVPADLEDDALEALEVARDTGSVKKGTNETTKAVERGNAMLVFVAEDVSPEEVVMHLPDLCAEKDIPYIFVGAQDDVGRAAGLEVGSAAAAIVDAGEATTDVEEIGNKIEELR